MLLVECMYIHPNNPNVSRKIPAIKALREVSSFSLRESKGIVESMMAGRSAAFKAKNCFTND